MKEKVALIGGGAMAEAILTGLKQTGKILENIWVYDTSAERLVELEKKLGITPASTAKEAMKKAKIVILAVKPQVLPTVLPEVSASTDSDTVVASIAAGIDLAALEKGLAGKKVIRVMPNTPLMIGQGMSGLCTGTLATSEDLAKVEEIFAASGKTLIVKEAQFDALSGISGCGPAFVYLFIESLMDAGVLNGLTRKDSLLLAAQTMQGAARMVLETGMEPAALRGQVTSPGGTTIAGIHTLEKAAVRGAIMDAVGATIKRSEELGKNG